ncbi:MAG: NUDIX domain-containing protein [Pseudomonadota bacterium]
MTTPMTEDDFPLIGSAPNPSEHRAALILHRDAEGRLLMQLRDDREGVNHRGTWGLFGGMVEPGEDIFEAAAREFEEESGVTVPEGALHPFGWTQSTVALRTRVFCFDLRMALAPVDIRLDEGAGFAFLTAAQVRDVPVATMLRPIVDAFLAAPR